jgi:hypothetical protein
MGQCPSKVLSFLASDPEFFKMLVRNNPSASYATNSDHESTFLRVWLPAIFAAAAYFSLLRNNVPVLLDSDVYWHILTGQWIIDHLSVPYVDRYSFTMLGEQWITTAWFSEVLYASAFRMLGWAGVQILAASVIGLSFLLLTKLLLRRLPNVPVMLLVVASIFLSAPHMLARPHVLVFPLLVVWSNEIVSAAEQERAPSFWYLPLITLWANLHGSFPLALALMGPFAAEAVCNTDKPKRVQLAYEWVRFGILGLAASCITPYGPESLVATLRVLGLGNTLSFISEWQPQDFTSFSVFLGCLLAGMAYALYTGLRLPLFRVIAVLAVFYETLIHYRHIDVLAMAGPFFIAGPLADHLSRPLRMPVARMEGRARLAFVGCILAMALITAVIARKTDFTPPLAPRLAVQKIREVNGKRIFNEYFFGGYLIFNGIPVFVDGRAELYGPTFLSRYRRAIMLQDVADLVRLLDEYRIDTTLLLPGSQLVGMLDRLDGWQRVYSDELAVVHQRVNR